MAKATTIKDALKAWEDAKQTPAAEAEVVKLCGVLPPIEKMDATLSTLKKVKQLSLSTNAIEKIGSIAGCDNLEILSLGRNQIKKIENLDAVADTLQQLWISYNNIEKLAGIEKLKKLKVLYMSNNKVDKWNELERLRELPELEDLVFIGNPLERGFSDNKQWRIEVLKRLSGLKKIDGAPVEDDEREEARRLSEG